MSPYKSKSISGHVFPKFGNNSKINNHRSISDIDLLEFVDKKEEKKSFNFRRKPRRSNTVNNMNINTYPKQTIITSHVKEATISSDEKESHPTPVDNNNRNKGQSIKRIKSHVIDKRMEHVFDSLCTPTNIDLSKSTLIQRDPSTIKST